MPDPRTLKVGDKIRILRVPRNDLEYREERVRAGLEPTDTVDVVGRIIADNPIVTIKWIDEDGFPWFSRQLINAGGEIEEHGLAVHHDDSWEPI